MSKGVQASLGVAVAVFGFDPEPGTPSHRALHLLTARRRLPHADLQPRERFEDAAHRALEEAGLQGGSARRGRSPVRLHLVGVDDAPAARARSVTVWYYATAPFIELAGPGSWLLAGSRSPRIEAGDLPAYRAALERLRTDARHVSGASALVGEVFTGDDLLRVHIALHGGPEGSERTFRRRVQELRDSGVLKPVRESEVAALRLRVPRFRSPAGTGGRPPELLRYAGTGGEDEQLASLRARRSA